MRASAILVACLVVGVGLGCGSEAPVEGEEVGVAEQAIGETGCQTSTPYATVSIDCGGNGYASPDTSYGSTGCPDQFVVEFTNVATATEVVSGWGDAIPTSQSVCENSHYSLAIYDYFAGWQVWNIRSVSNVTGVWNGSSCSFAGPALNLNGAATKSRVVTKAWVHTIFGDVKKKARSVVIGPAC